MSLWIQWSKIVGNTLFVFSTHLSPQEFPARRQRNGNHVITYRHLLDYLEMLASSASASASSSSASASSAASSSSDAVAVAVAAAEATVQGATSASFSGESVTTSSTSTRRVHGREEEDAKEEDAKGLGRVGTHFLPFLGMLLNNPHD